MTVGFALALLTAPAAMSVNPVSVVISQPLTPQELREERKRDAKLARLCRSAAHHGNNLSRLDADANTLSEVATRLWYGERGCVKNPALAITVLRFVIGDNALRFGSAETVAQLARYLRDRGDIADRAELLNLSGKLWLRGDSFLSYLPPEWTPEERRAFIARDDIWAFISAPDSNNRWHGAKARLEALLDPLSPRHSPLEAVTSMEAGYQSVQWVRAAKMLLDGKQIPPDTARAQPLLIKAAPYEDEARLLLGPDLTTRLASSDPSIRDAAIQQFEPWAHMKGPGAAAIRSALHPHYLAMLAAPRHDDQRKAVRALTPYALLHEETDPVPLLHWIEAALRKDDEADKRAAWHSLSQLAGAKIAGTDRIMNDAFARAGGLVDAGPISPTEMTQVVLDFDYPPRAIREEQQGVVESEAIISPDGRAFLVTVTKTPWPMLGEIVQRKALIRLRMKNPLPYPGRYVRITLPPIQFRLLDCDNGKAQEPAVDGAWLVNGTCFRPIVDVPIP